MESLLSAVLHDKGNVVYTVAPAATVCDAVRLMTDHRVGSVVVYDAPAVLGVLDEREVLLRIVREARHPRYTAVAEVMIADPITVPSTLKVGEAMAIMTHHRTRHLPVVDEGQLIGLVSIGDLTRWVTRNLDAHIHHLERFIVGAYA